MRILRDPLTCFLLSCRTRGREIDRFSILLLAAMAEFVDSELSDAEFQGGSGQPKPGLQVGN
jgi:hypothetical protein